MEHNRNWQGWIAIALSAVALVIALGGRFERGDRYAYVQAAPAAPVAPAAPAAPPSFGEGRFERGHGGTPPMMREQMEGELRGDARFGPGMERGFGHGMGHGHGRHGFGPLGMLFGLIGGLLKLVAFGLFAWLLLKIFQQRRQQPMAPTTPAGHDPRVE